MKKIIGRVFLESGNQIEIYVDKAKLEVTLEPKVMEGNEKKNEIPLNEDEVDRLIHGLQCSKNHL